MITGVRTTITLRCHCIYLARGNCTPHTECHYFWHHITQRSVTCTASYAIQHLIEITKNCLHISKPKKSQFLQNSELKKTLLGKSSFIATGYDALITKHPLTLSWPSSNCAFGHIASPGVSSSNCAIGHVSSNPAFRHVSSSSNRAIGHVSSNRAFGHMTSNRAFGHVTSNRVNGRHVASSGTSYSKSLFRVCPQVPQVTHALVCFSSILSLKLFGLNLLILLEIEHEASLQRGEVGLSEHEKLWIQTTRLCYSLEFGYIIFDWKITTDI